MKIVIAGAGEIGYELSKVLSEENHDVTVIDQRPECLRRVEESLDVLTIEGNATSPHTLLQAGTGDAQLMIAVTSIDEVNIIASTMAKRLGAKNVIARVRNNELSLPDSPIHPSELGIDVLIHPEKSAATEIHQLLKRASASDLVSLADGRMQLIGLRLERNSSLIGLTLAEVASAYRNIEFRIVAISRRNNTIIPRGNNRLQGLDHLFILSKTEDVRSLIQAAGHRGGEIRNVMIAGGTPLAKVLVDLLTDDQQKWSIKLIEPDRVEAEQIAAEYPELLVLHGDPADPNLLGAEGVQETDAFISVTDDEESNIISCLMAKHLDVRKTVALVSKPQYIPLSQTIGLDAIVNVKASASDEIHRQVRQGQLLTVKALLGIKAEILEAIAGPNCPLLDHPLHSLDIPDGIVIGGILKQGRVEIATGKSVIENGDRVILFALPRAIERVEKLFL